MLHEGERLKVGCVNPKNYQIEKFNGYIVLKLQGDLSFKESKAFEGEIDGISNTSSNHVYVNCEHLVGLSKEWIRNLLKIQINLKSQEKQLKLFQLNSSVLSFLKKEGIDGTFKIVPTLKEALEESSGTGKQYRLDTEFINPFLTATMHVLKVQANVEVKAGQIFRKKETDSTVGDVSGIIGIVSDAFNGSVVISFPEKTFLNIMSSMLGEEYTKLDKEIVDGAGELLNMIFGQAKIVLNDKGYGIKTAIPSVVTGKDHSATSLTKGPVVVVPFEGAAGSFLVEICLSA